MDSAENSAFEAKKGDFADIRGFRWCDRYQISHNNWSLQHNYLYKVFDDVFICAPKLEWPI